jgi:hypothetical protein
MALGWVSLAADECDSMVLGPREKTVYRLAELRLSRHWAVQGVTLGVVVLVLLRAPTQLLPKEQVADASLLEGMLQTLAVELGSDARVRVRPDISDELDPLARQQRCERLKRVVRVTDRPDSSSRHGPLTG